MRITLLSAERSKNGQDEVELKLRLGARVVRSVARVVRTRVAAGTLTGVNYDQAFHELFKFNMLLAKPVLKAVLSASAGHALAVPLALGELRMCGYNGNGSRTKRTTATRPHAVRRLSHA